MTTSNTNCFWLPEGLYRNKDSLLILVIARINLHLKFGKIHLIVKLSKDLMFHGLGHMKLLTQGNKYPFAECCGHTWGAPLECLRSIHLRICLNVHDNFHLHCDSQ